MRRLRYSVPYIAGKNLPKDSDPAPRGAGQSCGTGRPNWPNFNPPAPCGAGRGRPFAVPTGGNFNPPAPCGAGHSGMDAQITMLISIHPPLAGRDLAVHVNLFDQLISIHPPLAGRDYAPTVRGTRNRYFNPPAPCGAGLPISSAQLTTMKFQSTRPLRGGTTAHLPAAYAGPISIHPPLAGRDQPFLIIYIRYLISIHPPLAGRDGYRISAFNVIQISIHPPLAGRDLYALLCPGHTAISIHPPLAGRDV